MTITQLIHSFAADAQLQLVVILIAADLVFGVAAALKAKTFKLSYLAQFARDDVLAKVVPWFALFAFSKVAPNTEIGSVGFGALSTATFAIVTASLGASILMSLRGLGVPVPPLAGVAE